MVAQWVNDLHQGLRDHQQKSPATTTVIDPVHLTCPSATRFSISLLEFPPAPKPANWLEPTAILLVSQPAILGSSFRAELCLAGVNKQRSLQTPLDHPG
jgi:hypothetical protein